MSVSYAVAIDRTMLRHIHRDADLFPSRPVAVQ